MPKKDRMGQLVRGGRVFTCSQGTLWPPKHMVVYETANEARSHVPGNVYQKLRVWEQACGQREMNENKCPSCPYVEVDGVRARVPGSQGYKHRPTTATPVAKARRDKESKR